MIDYTALAAASMSLIGTLVGTFGGILVANKLTNYRIGTAGTQGSRAQQAWSSAPTSWRVG